MSSIKSLTTTACPWYIFYHEMRYKTRNEDEVLQCQERRRKPIME